MDMDALINEFCSVDDQIKALEKRKDQLKAELVPVLQQASSVNNVKLTSSLGKSVRLWIKRDVQADLLQPLISKAMWLRITKRVPVADFIKAEVARGRLDVSIVDASRKESRPSVVQA